MLGVLHERVQPGGAVVIPGQPGELPAQMKAYGDLVAAVAATVDQFRDAIISDRQLLTNLCEINPLLCAPLDDPAIHPALDSLAGGAWCRLASPRQQLLATMVLMGVQRVRQDRSGLARYPS